MEVTCFTYEGIDAVKDSLLAGAVRVCVYAWVFLVVCTRVRVLRVWVVRAAYV